MFCQIIDCVTGSLVNYIRVLFSYHILLGETSNVSGDKFYFMCLA